MNPFPFGKLKVYQESKRLVISVYSLIDKFPSTERYELASQLQRAITSVTSNIAECSGRRSLREKIHFVEIAYGSLTEAYSQLEIAFELHYLTHDDLIDITPQFMAVSRMLSGLADSFEKRLNEENNL